ncbi:DUF342 domain-containing protein [Paraglaciecola arctica]|uniref:Flagellar Assembly Protein A N-terminal region domain-containing protein n=1 Tax=Paraglaciecola arctica BSs20135 TaxID=493475 RepID=K6XFP4_9ALTE|nr:FapA family protein [Paraglaciecola arctica]GAC19459.1 hypothetical protein GARC_2493 [Paraglaciecola arctica BSs20135]
MLGITLKVDETDQYLDLDISPDLVQEKIDAGVIHEFIQKSEFKHFFIFDENIIGAINSYKSAKKNNISEVLENRIGERRDTQIKYKIVEDQLSAYLTLITGYAGKLPTVKSLKEELNTFGIKRGVSSKGLTSLVKRCTQALPGEVFEELIAKGLPAKVGKSSQLKPLVLNALDRILKPQTVGSARVDMRNLGSIICVQKGTELLRRMPPTKGRNGYTVSGDIIDAKSGEWVKFRPGEGTVISDGDENLLLADISGMPKFKDQKMWVDDIFICKGVNVGSGNVEYDGSVLVNGDVTEKMEIYATGDVTVNGFVESATIHAGGDIIITEGAMGKVNDSATEYSTSLTSKGSVHVQHGQGLDINCNGNVTVGRQLAYSRINCRGKVTVGALDKPNGNIFACTIKCQDAVTAGTLGAVSGSNLSIDFSEGFNTLLERKDTLDELLKKIKQNNTRHFERMNIINSKFIPHDMQGRVDNANQLFENETQLLQWLESKAKEMNDTKEKYQTDIQLIGNKRVYPGVVVKLNNRTWRAEREYDRAKICFKDHQWHFEPLT